MNTQESTNGNANLSWSDLNLNNLIEERSAEATSQKRSELPAGNYKFKLVSAKDSPYQPGTTDLDLVVVDGPQSRRHLFATIPAPHITKYAAQFAGVLIKALGGTAQPGETLVQFLNRIAPTASSFTADVADDTWVDKVTNETRSKPKLMYFSIQPAV